MAGMLITGGLFFTPAKKNLKGVWLIETAQGECSSKVLRIQMHQGVWKGLADYPVQKKYDRPVVSIHVEKDSIDILLNEDERISGNRINDSLIVGTFIRQSLRMPVELKKQ